MLINILGKVEIYNTRSFMKQNLLMEVLSMPANREYKDSVFSLYLSNPERLIDVYNAVAKTNYPLDTPVEINTLTNVLYKNQLNDLSFVLDNQYVVLIEHQSTINDNMALRLLLYCARVYEKMLKKCPVHKRMRVKIPVPKFIVLYNGKADYPEYSVQKLSESFKVEQENPALELKVEVYNINYAKSPELIERSEILKDYSLFVQKVRDFEAGDSVQDEHTLERAIATAIRYCIEHDIMAEFLETHGSEVSNLLLEEWNMDEALKDAKEEGKEEKQQELIRQFSKINTPEQIAETLQVSVEYVLDILKDKPM